MLKVINYEKMKKELIEQLEIVIKKLEVEYNDEINSGIMKLIYKRYLSALDILKNDKDITKLNIVGGVRAYMDSYNDYNNQLLEDLHKTEKLSKKLV